MFLFLGDVIFLSSTLQLVFFRKRGFYYVIGKFTDVIIFCWMEIFVNIYLQTQCLLNRLKKCVSLMKLLKLYVYIKNPCRDFKGYLHIILFKRVLIQGKFHLENSILVFSHTFYFTYYYEQIQLRMVGCCNWTKNYWA